MGVGPSRQGGHHPVKPQLAQIEFIHECTNNAHRIVFADAVIKALRQQRDLTPILSFNEPFHLHHAPQPAMRILLQIRTFSHSLG